jgi:phosphoglycerol geranylgeranyltransferase
MNVYISLMKKLKSQKLHMTLIDPDKQSPEYAGEIASNAHSIGTDAIMIGGSTGVTTHLLDETVQAIKRKVKIPVILFPTNVKTISKFADAIYFMSMLNSRDIRFIIREQMRGAPIIKKLDIEPISLGYIIVEPGMKAGEVGNADAIKRSDVDTAVGYALSAEFLGMKLVYLEAGSGAPEPVPKEMIKAVKNNISIPLIVGGGIRTKESAEDVINAGADIIVTGTLIENHVDALPTLKNIIEIVKQK